MTVGGMTMGMVEIEATMRRGKVSRRLTHQAIGVPMIRLRPMVQAAIFKDILTVVISSGVRVRDKGGVR
jgi:hypothetical protein